MKSSWLAKNRSLIARKESDDDDGRRRYVENFEKRKEGKKIREKSGKLA